MKIDFNIGIRRPVQKQNFSNITNPTFGNKIADKATDTFIKKSVRFKTSDLFVPLEQIKQKFKTELEPYKDLIPEKLFKKMHEALDENNFNLRKVYEISTSGTEPPKGLNTIFKKGEDVINKYTSMPEMNYKDINNFAKKFAVKKSNYWADFRKMTDKNIWTPMRFIRYKYSNTSGQYNTQRLTDLYLSYLYGRGYQGFTLNPLAQFDSQKLLSKDIVNTINYLYMTIYRNPNIKFENEQFKNFASRFDKNGIGKSIEHMEFVFRKHFMDNYNTGIRKQKYDKAFEEGTKLIREKLDFVKANKEQNFKTLKKPQWVQATFF